MGSVSGVQRKPRTPPKDDVFDDLKGTKFSFEAALQKMKWVCEELRKFDSARGAAVSPAINFLSLYTSASSYGAELARLWGDKLVHNGVVEICAALWPSFWKPSDFIKTLDKVQTDPSVETTVVDEARVTLENMWYLCRILWNGSDASKEMCVKIVEVGIVEEMLKLLDRDDFNPKKFMRDNVRTYIVKAATGVLHNCLRLNHYATKEAFRSAGGVKVLQRYLDSDVQMVKTKASICLSFGINEEEIDVINAKDDIIRYIITRLLSPSLNSKDHRALGFSAAETMESLNELAQNDENKLRMGDNGVIPLYFKAIKNPLDDEELLHAIKGIWILSFKPENAKKIQEFSNSVKELEERKSHKNGAISQAATGALWNLDGRGPSAHGRPQSQGKKKKGSAGTPKTAHVMISYDWGHKEVVRALNRCLKDMGYNTWLDDDRMSGSTLEAMADAIENSSVVVVCMSDRYKNSPSCRTEAEYAYRLGKPIIPLRTEYKYLADGWLGILMGTKLYFDCHTMDLVDGASKRLAKELGDRGKLGYGQPQREEKRSVAPLGAKPGRPETNHGSAESKGQVENWKPVQVKQWLQNIGLSNSTSKFASFDGPLLLELQGMYHKAPTVFYQTARQDLGLSSLSDMLKLTRHLDKLK